MRSDRYQKTFDRKYKVDVSALRRDLEKAVDGEVRFGAGAQSLFNCDAGNYRMPPLGVVLPRTTAAIESAVEVCRKHHAPIVSRGCGTALAGQTCNAAVVIDHSKYLTKILEIDPDRRIARVQPGVILDHLRNKTDKEHHLTYGPDPATHDHCTFGGMLGNDSCGIHSVMAGCTAANVIDMEVLTYDGLRMRVGATSDEELDRIVGEGGRRGEIYKGMRSIRDRYGELVRQRYPDIPRRVSGYNLDQLLPENGFHVARALVGSEGTLATILEATVRLVHSPPGRTLLVLGYPDVYAAGDHVMEIMKHSPVGLEGIDDRLINYMKLKHLHTYDIKLLPEGGGWLLVEFGGDDKPHSVDRARKCMEDLKKADNPPSMKLYDDPSQEELVWEIRESGLGATANVPTLPLMWPGWEDASVPPERLGGYLRDFRGLLDKHKYKASMYGHFGQGCIHCRISFDLFTHEGIDQYMHFIDEASDLVVRYGGSFSAEHGDGQSKAYWLPKMFGTELIDAFRRYKQLWDPEWMMNPGKVIDPYRPDEHLRLGVDYNPEHPRTWFQFPKDKGSFSNATLRCVGVGKCRRTENAFMCPSFLVTRDEKDTTRGRAHLLFEMLRGQLIKDGWRSKEVLESLDLCLACKGCKKDCPVDVDMATCKAEFLSHHYEKRLRPRTAYSMGLIGFWGRLGSSMPRTANFFGQTAPFSTFIKWVGGIAPQRSMPRFALQTYTNWYRHQKQILAQDHKKVVLYPDVFNDFFYPETLKAAFQILRRWGYDVLYPDGTVPSIRPLIHYGMLKQASKHLKRAIHQLSRFARQGVPILFLEPSTAAVFADELPGLVPHDKDGERVTNLTMLLSQFIEGNGLPLPRLEGKAVFHGHCHQKAVFKADDMRNTLKKMGLRLEEPQLGCCGMAGSFGFEAKHYDISMQIADLNLVPAVKKASEDTYIVADGFSCRTQIMDGTGRKALHLAEILLLAMEQDAPERQAREAKSRRFESVSAASR